MRWDKVVIQYLEKQLEQSIELIQISTVGGGDINEAYRLETSAGDFFVKKNSASRFPGMFQKEASGLCLLREANEIKVPEVIGFTKDDNEGYLILKYIAEGVKSTSFWNKFGTQLARLHSHSNEQFGLDHDNYIGSLQQSNKKHASWEDFFIRERLEIQLRLARNNGMVGKEIVMAFEKFYKRINEIFPKEPPALVHGDLWGGNYMVDEAGDPVLIDPAVYYGHREMDLAMSKLFGGFDPSMYHFYHQQFPLEKGWEQSVDYCNLYPLMVHVNLFGQGYLGSVKSILKAFL